MPPVTGRRIASLLWATLIVATITTACGYTVEAPPPGAQIVSSGPSDLDAASVAATQDAKPKPSPVAQIAAASPTPAVAAPVATAPIARSASPAPTSALSQQRLTMTATFFVTNTLGKGMALRPAPIARNDGKVWPDGTRMAGLGAEQEAYGWTWRFVRDPDGNNGWMPSNYLVQDDSAPAPSSNGNGLLPPSAPPTLILVPTKEDPDSVPTPEPVSATPVIVEVVVTATPTAVVRATANAQPAGGARLTPTPSAARPNVNAPVTVPAPPNVPVPNATSAPVSGYAPGNAKPTGDPNDPPIIVPRVTGAQLEATRAANPALR